MLYKRNADWVVDSSSKGSLDNLSAKSKERNIVSIDDMIRDECALSAWPIKNMSIRTFDIKDGSDGTEI
jgi:hypothetical protein